MGLWYLSSYQEKVPGDLAGRWQYQGAQTDGAQLSTQDRVSVKGTWSLGEGSIHPHNLGSALLDSSYLCEPSVKLNYLGSGTASLVFYLSNRKLVTAQVGQHSAISITA